MAADDADGLSSDSDTQHLNTRVAWYYYIGSMTQQEIADRLGLTRLRVNKIIGQARADGSVQIEINMPLASCVALEESLKSRYGLVDVVVVPSVKDEEVQKRVIGEAAGLMLGGLLRDGQIIGVGWGGTLVASVKRLTQRRHPRSRVVSLMGGLTRGSAANTFEVATDLARVLGAECHYIPSPLYYPNDESFASLLGHRPLAEVMAEARRADVALVACGDLSGRSQLFSAVSLESRQIADLKALGTVGEVLGTFLDAEGVPVDHPLNSRVMALHPADLKAVKATILASGDTYKLPVIRAILRGGYINRLVTDEAVAEALLRGA
ncbi:sugar-binding transcriptional regulator [Rhodospirillum rubrum]|uniref:Transcriptional regulator, DeoR family n=1 Tax=Rhodospirillum rubrum (strain ATCC 11170 / ATH 1.1.1 / DSM 467 / LMG 4362 / NCIMB 8255 / S1) TaxID=269796 RepID=Q2RUM8_RHORT|nr:sugar-binding transcriptional regulator [Rhodospirillum rubrum]ABC22167.1 transcriptional regulator, DeoR family [Rhodospirillum rubrum ATCC 11170]AEO47881.1 DeoR family transcriptional regulator [Rhodospirillum rubrum F11]MBK1662944.1 DNA-binding transcriptional regulator [Rhodospirillum rubrum]MBK1675231.1 DNA-binding transcriptional regulator [Rhodospirillum rubrum]MBK5953755.1 DNA-binding transcriptional regulator [Rhodospirillum rubrum]